MTTGRVWRAAVGSDPVNWVFGRGVGEVGTAALRASQALVPGGVWVRALVRRLAMTLALMCLTVGAGCLLWMLALHFEEIHTAEEHEVSHPKRRALLFLTLGVWRLGRRWLCSSSWSSPPVLDGSASKRAARVNPGGLFLPSINRQHRRRMNPQTIQGRRRRGPPPMSRR